MRTVTRAPLALPSATATSDVVFTLEIEAVTPIYRGGASRDAIDTARPFRAGSIRGLLRYWWRALQPETDARTLWEREAELFGAIRRGRANASRVRVGVSGPPSRAVPRPTEVDYALWVQRDASARLFHEGARATLTVQVPRAHADELRDALSAWLLLGGIGSRSRRGLGAVHAIHPEVRPALASAEELARHLSRLSPAPADRRWPSLGGGLVLLGPPARDAVAAWKAAVQQMQALRQYPEVKRWHDDDYVVFAAGNRFVSRRASLGLPLQFQRRKGPERWSMRPVAPNSRNNVDRAPSPIHLRPILIGERWYPMMAVLRVPYPDLIQVSGSTQARGTVAPEGVQWFTDGLVSAGWERHVLRRSP